MSSKVRNSKVISSRNMYQFTLLKYKFFIVMILCLSAKYSGYLTGSILWKTCLSQRGDFKNFLNSQIIPG